jgi:hypothetical protein
MPPGFGIFGLTFFLITAGPLRSGNDGPVAIGLKHLPRVVMNFDFSHPHGKRPRVLVPSPASRRTLIQPASKSFHEWMIRKSGNRFSEKILLKQQAKAKW